ncbi:hypothetical protein KIL84_000712 [Mauremys mutica]|uniref:Uncharacterized protein n=1 Tax=Mauremys mutica TaxID=74926 RepID=A0A9D3WZ32_9SAUR|nr:hypothetical protein KIL84_000712 [Mauremys mutica]
MEHLLYNTYYESEKKTSLLYKHQTSDQIFGESRRDCYQGYQGNEVTAFGEILLFE